MRFFVASWFFPPATSSEGIVGYKLLRNSKHSYDVCSSTSNAWGYKQELPLNADNIRLLPVETDDLDTWVDGAVQTFCREHEKCPYDVLMTRSMPPESVEVAKRIRALYPDIPWVASIADPISKMPYHLQGWLFENTDLSESDKQSFLLALQYGTDAWNDNPSDGVQQLIALKEVEDYALNNADALIFPHDTVRRYVLGTRRRRFPLVVPHSFDRELIKQAETLNDKHMAPQTQDGVTTFVFMGHSDSLRSLAPIVRALAFLRDNDATSLERIRVRFIGNVPADIHALIFNFNLYDYISVEPSVDYATSLRIMMQTDWLIHIDAHFEYLAETGYSLFFAGKLADYMGTDRPILAITGEHSPAFDIVRRAGGVTVDGSDIPALAQAFADIATGITAPTINLAYRESYDAKLVAKNYDEQMDAIFLHRSSSFKRTVWPALPHQETEQTDKFLSICIPSYNVECTLDRTLYSLISSPAANQLDIIVVNDGSRDATHDIGAAYAERYPSIVRIVDKQNGGHGSTINTALKLAKGMYFRVIDGDDWVDGHALAKTLETIMDRRVFADLISSNYDQVYENDGHRVHWMRRGLYDDYTPLDFASNGFEKEYFTIHSMMVKTEILRKANFQITEHTFYVDCEYILYPIPYVKTVMFTPEFIYRYDVGNPDQSINPDKFVSRYDHHDRVMRRMIGYFADAWERMSDGQQRYVRHLMVDELLRTHYALSLLMDKDRDRGWKRAKLFDEFFQQTNPNLYAAFREHYRGVRIAQDLSFDYRKLDDEFDSLENGYRYDRKKRLFKKIARILSGNRIGNRLVHNRFANAIARRL